MSGMSNLCVEILDLVENGYDAEDIALMLEVPEDWVYEALAMQQEQALNGLAKDIAEATLD